jgi:hypothetical protein
MDLTQHPLAPRRIVAIATDKYLQPKHDFADRDLPGLPPKYGQDFTFGKGRAAPNGHTVGKSEADLKPKMEKLLDLFASKDKTGMARRLFARFLAKQPDVVYFEDADLNAAAAAHENIKYFCDAALGAPLPPPSGRPPAPGKTRIHQALKAANWDVTKLVAPTDLGVPAFNEGDLNLVRENTGDWVNGLRVMINGVQHVYVIATHYHYEHGVYGITLKYVFYDVFGLDDDDLEEYGAKVDFTAAGIRSDEARAKVGITAWWQLQHQHGYAPLVTRIVVEKSFHIPAA